MMRLNNRSSGIRQDSSGPAKARWCSLKDFSIRREIRSFYLWLVYCVDLTLSVPALTFPVLALLTVYFFLQIWGLRFFGI